MTEQLSLVRPDPKPTIVITKQHTDALLNKLDTYVGEIGFDTEVAGPLLRGQDFVNSSYAALLGISIAFEDGECYYLPVRHKGPNVSFHDLDNVMLLVDIMCSQRRVWAHNAQFDYMTMKIAGYDLSGLMCSMLAGWLITGSREGLGLKEAALRVLGRQSPPYDPAIAHQRGSEVVEYACHDALNTLQLGQHYDIPDKTWFFEECNFAHVLADMKLQGIAIDRDGLRKVREEAYEEMAKLQTQWDLVAPFISITSSKQLQTLFEEGIWLEHGRTGSGAYSTSKEAVQYQVSHGRGDGPLLASIRLDYQSASKLVTTYTDGLIEESLQWVDKKLHPNLWHLGTSTGRLSSSCPNIQNPPPLIREYMIPDPGMEFTLADFSQVELRYFANYCGGKLLDAFLQEKDPYQDLADTLGITRQQGKVIALGFLLYGGGVKKMSNILGVSRPEAKLVMDNLQAAYPRVAEWREQVIDSVTNRSGAYCSTLAGRIRFFPELIPSTWAMVDAEGYSKEVNNTRKKYGWNLSSQAVDRIIHGKGGRLVVNYLVQGGARDLLVIAMNRLRKHINNTSYIYPSYSIVTTVHDEVLIQHPIGEGETARALLKDCMEKSGERLGMKVPLIAEPKTGRTWGACK